VRSELKSIRDCIRAGWERERLLGESVRPQQHVQIADGAKAGSA
jgi:hypothetical protein